MRAKEFNNTKKQFEEMFLKFLPLAMKIIGLKKLPKMVFEKEIDSPGQPTFGQYINDEHVLHVGLANRHPNDILRTIAHELVHYKQDTEHQLDDQSGTTGSPEENEANAVAGIVMRNFNKRYPEYLKIKPLVVESNIEERKRKKIKHAAYGPGPYGWYGYDASYSGDSGSDGGAAESAGDRGDIPTGKGEQLIPFPQGTTMIDVSDVYDWYKLGMVISDLDDADPSIFGQGAPHTVIAFGSEEEEHKLLPLLKKLGLSVHDIDRPEDVKKVIPAKILARDLAETIRKVGSQYRLVSKSGKNLGTYPSRAGAEKRERQVQYFKHLGEELDGDKTNLILTKLCNLVLNKRKENSDLYGWVGACVLDENNNMVMATSTHDDGKWRHAERNAIDEYIKKYGDISENSVIVTTCSPCNESMKDRYGESCTDLINEIGIKTVYSGFTDPTQDEHQKHFEIVDCGDKKIKQLCRKFADKFLDLNENFADGRNPQDKGDSARHGIKKGMSIAQLKKVRSSDSASPRKKQLAHWQINMRQGRKK